MNKQDQHIKGLVANWLGFVALIVLLVGLVQVTKAAQHTTEPEESAALPTRAELQLTVLHTNDTWGYLWPCG